MVSTEGSPILITERLTSELEDTHRLLTIAMEVVSYLSERLEQANADERANHARLTELLRRMEDACS